MNDGFQRMVLQWIFLPETFSLNLVETTAQTRFQIHIIFMTKTMTKAKTKTSIRPTKDNSPDAVSNLYYFQEKDKDKGERKAKERNKGNGGGGPDAVSNLDISQEKDKDKSKGKCKTNRRNKGKDNTRQKYKVKLKMQRQKQLQTRPSRQCKFCISLHDKSFNNSGLPEGFS